MKIIFVSPGCFDKGGISRYNRYQVKLLRELYGHDNVKLLSLLGPDDHSFEEPVDTHWHGNGTSLKDKLQMVKQLFTLALRWKPDIILIGHVNLSGLCWMVAKTCGAHSILNAYGLEIWSGMSWDAARGLRNVDAIISDCHNTADYLVNNRIRRAEDITVIWDCIDVDRFVINNDPDKLRLAKYNIPDPAEHFIILTLGRLSKPDAYYKGYDRLLKVFSNLAAKYPAARLVIAGRGNYREDLEKMIASMRLDNKVFFTGSIDEADLALVYQSCHVFSLVTEAGKGKGEGIPLTPLEAMACGKPVMVGNQDGSREAIVDNANGFVLEPNDLERHREIIEMYMTDKALLQQQSASAAAIARSHFSYGIFKEKHASFLNNFVSPKVVNGYAE